MTKKESIELKADTIRRGLTQQTQTLIRIILKITRKSKTALSLLLICCFLSMTLQGEQVTQAADSLTETITPRERTDITPAVVLSTKDISVLKNALKNIEDERYRALTSRLINELEQKGTIDTIDIALIENETNMRIKIGSTIFTQSDYPEFPTYLCGGYAICLPGFVRYTIREIVREILSRIIIFRFPRSFNCIGNIVQWNCDNRIGNVVVNGNVYTGTGCALGYTGRYALSNGGGKGESHVYPMFYLKGVALITYISQAQETGINQSITLTKNDLPILKAAVPRITNEQYRNLTQTIIAALEENGVVNQSFLNSLSPTVSIKIGCILKTTSHGWPDSCLGNVFTPNFYRPRSLVLNIMLFLASLFAPDPPSGKTTMSYPISDPGWTALCIDRLITWNLTGEDWGDRLVVGSTYAKCNGLSIGFTGIVEEIFWLQKNSMALLPYQFYISGLGLLTFISGTPEGIIKN